MQQQQQFEQERKKNEKYEQIFNIINKVSQNLVTCKSGEKKKVIRIGQNDSTLREHTLSVSFSISLFLSHAYKNILYRCHVPGKITYPFWFDLIEN